MYFDNLLVHGQVIEFYNFTTLRTLYMYCYFLAAAEMGTEKDNRNLLDSDTNQKLSRDEIEQLKKEGVTGEVR